MSDTMNEKENDDLPSVGEMLLSVAIIEAVSDLIQEHAKNGGAPLNRAVLDKLSERLARNISASFAADGDIDIDIDE